MPRLACRRAGLFVFYRRGGRVLGQFLGTLGALLGSSGLIAILQMRSEQRRAKVELARHLAEAEASQAEVWRMTLESLRGDIAHCQTQIATLRSESMALRRELTTVVRWIDAGFPPPPPEIDRSLL